jgi:hypothetical protein
MTQVINLALVINLVLIIIGIYAGLMDVVGLSVMCITLLLLGEEFGK